MVVYRKRVNPISALVCGCLAGSISAVGYAADDANGALPDAKAGECYVKALVPPSYREETVNQLLKEASEKFTVLPAKFSESTEKLLIKDASTKITVTEPKYKQNDYTIVVAEARREYVRGNTESNIAASSGTLVDLAAAGIDIDSAEAGACFYEHYKPPTIESSVEKALLTEATETLEVVPAVYREEEKEVLIKPASSRILAFPATYKTVEVQQLIEPAKTVWQKGTGPVQKIDDTTGEIMCRVELPAVYETFEQQVIDSPARTSVVPLPEQKETFTVSLMDSDAEGKRTPVDATYQDVTKYQVLDDASFSWVAGAPGNTDDLGEHTGNVVCVKESPEITETVKQTLVVSQGEFTTEEVPAVYEDRTVQTLVSDASATSLPIQAENMSFNTRTKVADARFEWRPVLCETNVTDDLIANVQKALIDKGYDLEATPGLLSTQTFEAIEVFQQEENLPQGGLTMATLKALGVEM